MEALEIAELHVGVVRRAIKNMHLSVHPPDGRVSISVPEKTPDELIRVFVLGKLAWIRGRQVGYRQQSREAVRRYVARESHFVWGMRYLLDVRETEETARVALSGRKLTLFVRPGAGREAREAVFDAWLRGLVREAASAKLPGLEAKLGVKVARVFVQRMKTKWGSCNPDRGHIRLNSELARQPRSCIDYILLHELAHLIAPTHSVRFRTILDANLADWKNARDRLNDSVLRFQVWPRG